MSVMGVGIVRRCILTVFLTKQQNSMMSSQRKGGLTNASDSTWHHLQRCMRGLLSVLPGIFLALETSFANRTAYGKCRDICILVRL
jgi:hypothetical protein